METNGQAASLAGGRLLVVDDEVAWVELIDSMLSGLRARVCGVTDPREAVTMARIYAFDVAIVDWSLGAGLTGFDLVRTLRRFRPEMQCIIVSGHAADSLRRREPAIHSVPILAKPFESRALIETVAGALRPGSPGAPGAGGPDGAVSERLRPRPGA